MSTTPRTRLTQWLAVAACSGMMAGAVLAQEASAPTPPPATNAPMQAHGPRAPQDMQHRMQQHRAEKGTQHWERMKNILQLQPKQQADWDAYVAAMQPQKPQARPELAKHPKDMTTLERLDWKAQMRKTHQQNAEQRDQATRKFYRSLSAQQQKAFDSMHLDKKMHKGPRQHRDMHW